MKASKTPTTATPEAPKRSRGRPALGRSPHTNRQIGRVSPEDWEALQAAASASGQTFTAWALAILLKAAKKSAK